MKAPNPIDVVERAYQLEGSDDAWLRDVLQNVAPLLDGGCGLIGYAYDIAIPSSVWLEKAVSIGITDEQMTIMKRVLDTYGKDQVNRMQRAPVPLSTLVEASTATGTDNPLTFGPFASYLKRLDACDAAALRTIEPGGRGLVLCGFQKQPRTFERRTKALWAKVSTHLAAGRRLREQARAVEAVLTPSGKVEHAEGEGTERSAREALRDAVIRQEKARGRARREDPEGATEMWTALVSGRWSLVDQFERGGRRYVVARRNEQGCADPRALGPRERDVVALAALGKPNKLIAYELGLSPSTVGSHLSSAMRKLGVTSRVDLMRAMFASLAKP